MISSFIIAFALANTIGGRWKDVAGSDASGGRVIFRIALPAILAGLAAYELDFGLWALWVLFAVAAGSAFWAVFGWSFEEITGTPDDKKYPAWIRRIGYWLVPSSLDTGDNRKRGIILKGIRGAYDFITFLLLLPVNKYAPLFWLATFAMGAVYWAISRIVPGEKRDVMVAEMAYGGWRGFLIISLLAYADFSLAGWLI